MTDIAVKAYASRHTALLVIQNKPGKTLDLDCNPTNSPQLKLQ
jgi:hypothetical protein